jgi:hypothetical protein
LGEGDILSYYNINFTTVSARSKLPPIPSGERNQSFHPLPQGERVWVRGILFIFKTICQLMAAAG